MLDAEAAGDWVSAARALNNLTRYVPWCSPEAPGLLDQMLQAADRAGFDVMSQVWLTLQRAEWAFADADQPLLRRLVDQASELEPVSRRPLGDWIRALRAMLLIEEGWLDEAEELLAAIRPDEHNELWRGCVRLRVAGLRGDQAAVDRHPRPPGSGAVVAPRPAGPLPRRGEPPGRGARVGAAGSRAAGAMARPAP